VMSAFCVPASPAPFRFFFGFFGFDFFAEFLFFGVSAAAFFAFGVAFFGWVHFFFVIRFGFAVIRFGFFVADAEGEGRPGRR
jgi:hypothetical protein